MAYRQAFKVTSTLGADILREEVRAILDEAPDQMTRATPADYDISQKGGTGVEPVVIIFLSKVAYDVWRELILPRLKAKYGGAAAHPIGELEET